MKDLDRKMAKHGLIYRLWMYIVHDIYLPKYYYTETKLECYSRNVRNGNSAYVMLPPILSTRFDDEVEL